MLQSDLRLAAAAQAGAGAARHVATTALETVIAWVLGARIAWAVFLAVAVAGIAGRHAGARGARIGHIGRAADQTVIAVAIGAGGAGATVSGAGAIA